MSVHLQMNKVSDTTAAQARRGKDIQGIPWDRLHFTREKYRETRLQQYKNYVNVQQPHDELEKVTDDAVLCMRPVLCCSYLHPYWLEVCPTCCYSVDSLCGADLRTLVFICTGVQSGREGKGVLPFPTQH